MSITRVSRRGSVAAAALIVAALAAPAAALADYYSGYATLARPLPTTVTNGDGLPGQIIFGRRFASLEQVCFHFGFGADNPLNAGEAAGLAFPDDPAFPGAGFIASSTTFSRSLCLQGGQTTAFLDGTERVEITAEAWPDPAPGASYTLQTFTLDAIGQAALNTPVTRAHCKRAGWRKLTDSRGVAFVNQGDCVSWVSTRGRNPAGNGH